MVKQVKAYLVAHADHDIFRQIVCLLIVLVVERSIIVVLITVVQVRADDLLARINTILVRLDFGIASQQSSSGVSSWLAGRRTRVGSIIVTELGELVVLCHLTRIELAIRLERLDVVFVAFFLVEFLILVFRYLRMTSSVGT